MYQLVYNTNELTNRNISQILNTLLIINGNKVANKINYGLTNKINYTDFLIAKNLKSLLNNIEDSSYLSDCVNLNKKDTLTKIYNLFPLTDVKKPKPSICKEPCCTKPLNLAISYTTLDTATISWDMVFGEVYDIYVNTYLVESNVSSPYTITGLSTDVDYVVRISSGDVEICNTEITVRLETPECLLPTQLVVTYPTQPTPPLGHLQLNWVSGGSLNSTGQIAKKRIKGASVWDTTGFSPINTLSSTATTTMANVDLNNVYEFQIDNQCVIGGIGSSNIYEGIVFNCTTSNAETDIDMSTINVNTGFSLPLSITKIRFTLKKTSDNSVVYGPAIVNVIAGGASTTATGLLSATDYYWTYDLYAVVNGVEVNSSQSPYNQTCTLNITTSDVPLCPQVTDLVASNFISYVSLTTPEIRLDWTTNMTNVVNQIVKKRVKGISTWDTTGFTPGNPLGAATVQASTVIDDNVVYEFQVDTVCQSGTVNGNIVEGIIFACSSNNTSTDTNSSSITVNNTSNLPLSITKVKFTLTKDSDSSIVYGPTTVNNTTGSVTANSGAVLTPSTAYTWHYELFAIVNGIEIGSSTASSYLSPCEAFVFTTSTPPPSYNLEFNATTALGQTVNSLDVNGLTPALVVGTDVPFVTDIHQYNTTQIGGSQTLNMNVTASISGTHITVTDSASNVYCQNLSVGTNTISFPGLVLNNTVVTLISIADGVC